jgi:Zn-dependent protease with chaperone function
VIVFVLRGLAVSLSVFVLAYVLLRLVVACGWALTRQRLPWLSPNALYSLQVGPFAFAALIVGAFTIPSFIRFEPRVVEEEFGAPVIILSLICLTLLAGAAYRAWIAYARTNSIVREWRKSAAPVRNAGGIPIYQTGPDAPPLVVAGFWRPQLMVSSSTSTVLSEDELARAISHESAHVDNHDNLKKLVLRVLSFPRAKEIEQRWLAAVEINADRLAVNNQREALDLASALVKASRLGGATAELTTNLTSDPGALLQLRVQRLISWDASRRSHKLFRFAMGMTAVAATLSAIVHYPALLLGMHSLAELLMQ